MRAVLRLPGVLPLFAACCVGRLSMGALGLLMILRAHDLTGSFAYGGLVAGAYTIAMGSSNPVLARLVDRRGQAVVLRVGAVACSLAIAAFALLPSGASVGLLAACAAFAGLAQPPVGACMRSLWPRLAPEPESRHAAYALDGLAGEAIYLSGPLLVVGALGSLSLPAALLFCGATILAGDVAFSLHPASRSWRPPERAEHHRPGALRARGVLVLMGAFALCGLLLGAVEVAVPALLEPRGERRLTGPLLALWGAGSLAGGLAFARAGAAADGPKRLTLLLAGFGAAHAGVALAGTTVALAALLAAAGLTVSPVLVATNAMLDDVAPPGALTEAFTWTTAGLTAGISSGAALSGALVESASPSLAFAVFGAGGLLAAGLVRAAAGGPLQGARVAPAAS